MKPQISLIILMITTLMIIFHTNADQKLIQTTCKRTPDYHLCTAIIRANPGGAAADVAGLGLIVVDVIKHKSNEALAIANKFRVRRCTEVYKAVLEGDIPVVAQSIRGNPKFAETAVADAAAEAGICDGALGVKVPELGSVNKYVSRVAGVALMLFIMQDLIYIWCTDSRSVHSL